MNAGRLFLSIVVGFVYIIGSDYVVNALWLSAEYKLSAALWRPEADIERRLLVMLVAQLLCSVAFMYIWAKTGWRRRSIADGAVFGFWMGVFQQVMSIMIYVVLPIPRELALKWFLVGVLQAVLLGALAAAVYKPRSVLGDRAA